MAVATAPTATHHVDARRPAMNQAGLWLFFFSETFLFAALLSARFYIAGFDRPTEVNQALGLAITTILILSSFTAYMAEVSIAHGDRSAMRRFLLMTIGLGLVFAAGVGLEWSTAEFTPSEPFGTAFFSMTGLHATHVLSGVAMLFLVWRIAGKGHFTKESHWGVEAVVKYWHFVDVVWVFFYPALYLISW